MTKKEKYFRVTWTDCETDCDEQCISNVKAFDIEHAEERFWESVFEWQGDCLGIMILEITETDKN